MKTDLIFAKKINGMEITGLVDISNNPIKVFCYCTEEIANRILEFKRKAEELDKIPPIDNRSPKHFFCDKKAGNFKVLCVRQCAYCNDAEKHMTTNKNQQ